MVIGIIPNIEKFTINPEWAIRFSGCDVYRVLLYTIEGFPEGYGHCEDFEPYVSKGRKAVESFLKTNNFIYLGSYRDNGWEIDGKTYSPEFNPYLKIPTGTYYQYEVIAVRSKMIKILEAT